MAIAAIRKRDKAVGKVATRSEAVAALNDCRTLLAIIHDSEIDKLERGRRLNMKPRLKYGVGIRSWNRSASSIARRHTPLRCGSRSAVS